MSVSETQKCNKIPGSSRSRRWSRTRACSSASSLTKSKAFLRLEAPPLTNPPTRFASSTLFWRKLTPSNDFQMSWWVRWEIAVYFYSVYNGWNFIELLLLQKMILKLAAFKTFINLLAYLTEGINFRTSYMVHCGFIRCIFCLVLERF